MNVGDPTKKELMYKVLLKNTIDFDCKDWEMSCIIGEGKLLPESGVSVLN